MIRKGTSSGSSRQFDLTDRGRRVCEPNVQCTEGSKNIMLNPWAYYLIRQHSLFERPLDDWS